MPFHFRHHLALCALGALAAAHALAATSPALPPDWYPESVAVGPDGTMYAGSWRQGAIARLAPGQDRFESFIPPARLGLANVQGLLADGAAGILWACSGDLGYTTVPATPSALKSFDLATGRPLRSYPLPDHGYCNDLAQDTHGTLYVTDSRHPRILRLARGGGALEPWLDDGRLGTGEQGFYLNGIALDGDGTLYASAVAAVPWLARVAIRADGSAGTVDTVTLPRTLKNADAIRVYGSGRIAIFESDAFGKDGAYGGQISLAHIRGRSAELETVVTGLNNPSSGLVAGGRIWYIESKYALLTGRAERDVPRGVPFNLLSVALPGSGQAGAEQH